MIARDWLSAHLDRAADARPKGRVRSGEIAISVSVQLTEDMRQSLVCGRLRQLKDVLRGRGRRGRLEARNVYSYGSR